MGYYALANLIFAVVALLLGATTIGVAVSWVRRRIKARRS